MPDSKRSKTRDGDAMHPAQRFRAPGSIQHGVPMKEILGNEMIRLVAESFASASAKFDAKRFIKQATEGLDALELSQRGRHIGMAIAEQLPKKFSSACRILLASFGPELSKTEGNGLAPFFYLPHAYVISERGIDDFEHGMRANYELTKRFSAEFSIRPYLATYRDECLELLAGWTSDPNPHVRRLVSEGTRPRLPWAMRLKEFQKDPSFTLPLLEKLKDDSELYVRRSVANHLGDLLKDHADAVYETCHRWIKEAGRKNIPEGVAKARKWIVRHAVRLPAKKWDPQAVMLRLQAR